MNIYHMQCIAPIIIMLGIGAAISAYGIWKGWW